MGKHEDDTAYFFVSCSAHVPLRPSELTVQKGLRELEVPYCEECRKMLTTGFSPSVPYVVLAYPDYPTTKRDCRQFQGTGIP